MKNEFSAFGEQKIKEIKIWAWIAAVLPITALSGIFFLWLFGNQTLVNLAMVLGATSMFAVAVIWWWWVLHSLYSLLNLWRRTDDNLQEVRSDLKEIRRAVRDFLFPEDK